MSALDIALPCNECDFWQRANRIESLRRIAKEQRAGKEARRAQSLESKIPVSERRLVEESRQLEEVTRVDHTSSATDHSEEPESPRTLKPFSEEPDFSMEESYEPTVSLPRRSKMPSSWMFESGNRTIELPSPVESQSMPETIPGIAQQEVLGTEKAFGTEASLLGDPMQVDTPPCLDPIQESVDFRTTTTQLDALGQEGRALPLEAPYSRPQSDLNSLDTDFTREAQLFHAYIHTQKSGPWAIHPLEAVLLQKTPEQIEEIMRSEAYKRQKKRNRDEIEEPLYGTKRKAPEEDATTDTLRDADGPAFKKRNVGSE